MPASDHEVIVTSVSPGSYEACVVARNANGFGPASPVSESCTVMSVDDDEEVCFVGTSSWEERDRELRKRAIDLDAADGDAQPRAKCRAPCITIS